MHELMNTTKEVFGKIEKNGEQGQAAKNQAQENLKYDFWLASLLYIDSRKRIRVREMCGSAQAVYELKEETLKNMYLFTDTELQYLLESRKKDLSRSSGSQTRNPIWLSGAARPASRRSLQKRRQVRLCVLIATIQ